MKKLLKILKISWVVLCLLALGLAGWLTHQSSPWLGLELPTLLQRTLGENVFELWLPGLAVFAVWGVIASVWLIKIALSSWLLKKRQAKWMAEN